MPKINFAIDSSRPGSLPLSAERVINAYAERQKQTAKNQVAIFGTPGIETFATCGNNGPIRGLFDMNGNGYAVSGQEFYSVTSAGVTTRLGTGITGSGPVSIDGNGDQVEIVNGSLGFTYTESTSTFAQISDTDFNAANTVAFIDDYFVLDWEGTNKFFLSGLLDGTNYDALDFASAESSPDRVKAVVNNEGVLLIVGEKTIEPWYNSGALDFPWQRIENATTDRGILTSHAFAKEDNSVFFMGEDRVFYRLSGKTPVRVSTHSQERRWQDYATISDCFCFSMAWAGHKTIYVVWPTEAATDAYDIASGWWHERQSYDPGGLETRWRGNCARQMLGQTLVGDAYSGKIGKVVGTAYTEFSEPVTETLVSPPIHAEGRMVFMPAFELDIETGVGLTTGQGSDPQVFLNWSDDGGRNWSDLQPWRSMGKIGEYKTRLRWTELGSFYQRTIKVSISDPVKRVVIAARAPGMYAGSEE